jgi:hypothetical protein
MSTAPLALRHHDDQRNSVRSGLGGEKAGGRVRREDAMSTFTPDAGAYTRGQAITIRSAMRPHSDAGRHLQPSGPHDSLELVPPCTLLPCLYGRLSLFGLSA